MKRWVSLLWKEPHALIAGSLWFLLSALPIVTCGPASLALARYMRARERGIRISWRGALSFALRECGLSSFLMGFSDLLVLLMAGGCLIAVLEGEFSMPARMSYAIMFMLDMLYLLSGIYRYPALEREPNAKPTALMARGFLMALANLGWTLLFGCAQLLALMICALTGVGVLLLFPAASSLLAVCAYGEMVKMYKNRDEEETDE